MAWRKERCSRTSPVQKFKRITKGASDTLRYFGAGDSRQVYARSPAKIQGNFSADEIYEDGSPIAFKTASEKRFYSFFYSIL